MLAPDKIVRVKIEPCSQKRRRAVSSSARDIPLPWFPNKKSFYVIQRKGGEMVRDAARDVHTCLILVAVTWYCSSSPEARRFPSHSTASQQHPPSVKDCALPATGPEHLLRKGQTTTDGHRFTFIWQTTFLALVLAYNIPAAHFCCALITWLHWGDIKERDDDPARSLMHFCSLTILLLRTYMIGNGRYWFARERRVLFLKDVSKYVGKIAIAVRVQGKSDEIILVIIMIMTVVGIHMGRWIDVCRAEMRWPSPKFIPLKRIRVKDLSCTVHCICLWWMQSKLRQYFRRLEPNTRAARS